MRRLVRLAFLAPHIVEAIVHGRQPVDLTADHLAAGEDLPHDWKNQEKILGFDLAVVPQVASASAPEAELIS